MNVSAYSTFGYVELATSKGLRVSHDLSPSSKMESMADAEHNSMHTFGTKPSTSVFRSSSNGDPKRIRKIDKIKQKLVDMLREIGFKLSNSRLPWSTLDAYLRKKRYTIINWPHGVVRDRDKGVSGLSAEDTDRLHDALFVDERRIQFVPCGEESASNNDQVASSSIALSSDRALENNISMMVKQPRFRVTTAAAFIERRQKRRRT
ncbi:hypothetical protein L210DRAFT_3553692 [Boletus edulis BED1]|uniref:Uncharacterized protein n=1 Tax=Boletus edulis BED1 TaxID=1328754 RepID=A0AAD4BMG4_BOLED|nr:hypothetical protein L210DRAFT_3553692 [Boletus edulis BED1]